MWVIEGGSDLDIQFSENGGGSVGVCVYSTKFLQFHLLWRQMELPPFLETVGLLYNFPKYNDNCRCEVAWRFIDDN